jgi:hypothetical protein
MKKAGIIIVIIGLAITLFAGVSFITREKLAGIGTFEIHANHTHTLSWSPVAGTVMIVIGVGFYLAGIVKSMT